MMDTELLALLKAELEDEWAYNHAEHCGDPCPHDASCHWPRPAVLDDPRLADVPGITFDEPPYLRRR